MKIIHKHIPDIEPQLAAEIAGYVQQMRNLKLDKSPGIAETIDWARGIAALAPNDENAIYNSLSCLLKSDHDLQLVGQEVFSS